MSKLAAFFDKGKKKKVCKASSVLNELSVDATSAVGGGGGLSSVGGGTVLAPNGIPSVLGGTGGSGPSGVLAQESSVLSSSSSSVSAASTAAGSRASAAVKSGTTQQNDHHHPHSDGVLKQFASAPAGSSSSSFQTTCGLADEDTDLADWGVEEATEIVGGRSKMSVPDGISEALASKVGMVDASTLRAKSEKKNLGWSAAAPHDVTTGSRQRAEEAEGSGGAAASQLTNGASPTGVPDGLSADFSVDCGSSSADDGGKSETNEEAASRNGKRSGGGGGVSSSSAGDTKSEKWIPSRLRLLKQQGSRAGPVDLALDKDPDLISSVRIAAQKQRVTTSTLSTAKSASRQIGGGGEATTRRPSTGGGSSTSSPQTTSSNIHEEGHSQQVHTITATCQQAAAEPSHPLEPHDEEATDTVASSATCPKEHDPSSSSAQSHHLTGLGEDGRRFDMLYLFERIGLDLRPPPEDAMAEKRIFVDDQLVRSKFCGRKKLAAE